MSKFRDEIDSQYVICPYCEYHSLYDPEDISESINKYPLGVTKECAECGQSYRLHKIYLSENLTEPDCELNNKKHVWEPRELSSPGDYHSFCSICNQIRPLEPKSETA